LDDDSLKITEPKWSSEAHSHEAWDPDWIVERFACLLVCQNRECGEVVAVGGRTHHEEDHDWEEQTMHWSRTFAPQVMTPAPPIFPVPEECPEDVGKELRKAFGLYWSDPASSAIRILVHRTVAGRLPIRRAQGDCLIAILVLDSDPAVVVVVPDIAASENDKAGLDLLFVEDETHFSASYCAETVQIGGVSD
jgi:hypothetical protein